MLTFHSFDTPLGPMTATAEDEAVKFLTFLLQPEKKREDDFCVERQTPLLKTVEKEVLAYFSGLLKAFQIPISFVGTPFQIRAWKGLQNIPYGSTSNYRQEAASLGCPKSVRAVAKAYGANPLALIVPCHRVIQSNGEIGGYNAGSSYKQWLLHHEKEVKRW